MKPPFVRYDKFGKLTMMVYADGYVMCRRPGCMPIILIWKDWQKLSHTALDSVKAASATKKNLPETA
jgi:hypothetical protein